MRKSTATESLEWTGERMVPEGSDGETFWDHVYRYRFAARFVNDKRVVDVACGEGYGTHSLSLAGARSVIGFDISPEACKHAQLKYGVDARCTDATVLPIPDSSVDLVVSFETIEHLSNPADFIRECARVLHPAGSLVISTPNRVVYSEKGHHNRFHCSEMTRSEFECILSRHFRSIEMYSQQIKTAPWWQIRSFAASNSPWLNVRGFWRFRRWILPSSLSAGTSGAEVSEHDRLNIAATILRRDGRLTRMFNPYDVRRSSASHDEQAKYLIAVCDRRKD